MNRDSRGRFTKTKSFLTTVLFVGVVGGALYGGVNIYQKRQFIEVHNAVASTTPVTPESRLQVVEKQITAMTEDLKKDPKHVEARKARHATLDKDIDAEERAQAVQIFKWQVEKEDYQYLTSLENELKALKKNETQ